MAKRKKLVELRPLHKEILYTLARCGFLTIPHLLLRKICSEKYLRQLLKELQTAYSQALINCIKYGKRGGGGRKPYYYYLTPYGKQITHQLTELPIEQIKMPGHQYPMIDLDYKHRYQHIECMIHLLNWIEAEDHQLIVLDHYYDRTKGKKQLHDMKSKTRIALPASHAKSYIEPDGIFIINTEKGEKLYLTELHRGKDSQRVIKQIKTHALIIKEGLAMEQYETEKNNRVLLRFEKASTQKRTITQLEEIGFPNEYQNYFISKNLEDNADRSVPQFGHNWINLAGEKVNIY